MSEAKAEVLVLGCGTSHGVPMIGCHCEVCTSTDPRDKRTRPSIFVQYAGARFLVDTAPELRLQCITHSIDGLDAVLFTHHHADHVGGLDDLRRFNWLSKKAVPCYGTQRTLDGLRQMFRYAFEKDPGSPHSRPNLEFHVIGHEPFRVNEAEILPIPLMHGPMPVLGFRFGPFAYCTDCNVIPEDSMGRLRNTQVLILDALRHEPHPAHFHLDQAVEIAQKIGAERTYFTHTTHDLPYELTNRTLPAGIELAYDGLKIVVP